MNNETKRKKYENCEAELKRRKVLKDDWTIHRDRYAADPMYRLLFFPQSRHVDEVGNETTFVDYCVATAIKILKKRYGPKLENDRAISFVFELLQKTRDCDPKIFFVLTILHWESSPFADRFEDLYDTEEDAGVFGIHGRQRFRQFMNVCISNYVEQTFNSPYNKFNVAKWLRDFVKSSARQYIMGILTTQSNPL